MLSDFEYARQSLGTHLFFTRIMKEHALFLELGFTPRDKDFMRTADEFRLAFDDFLREVTAVSDGVVEVEYLRSGEVTTPFTLRAEKATEYFTGIVIDTDLTRMEEGMSPGRSTDSDGDLVRRVSMLNNRALDLLNQLIRFKTRILRDVTDCKMFTVNYPLLIDHITREAKLYHRTILNLQNREDIDLERDAYEQELFWNRIMAEHSLFIRGLLDPTEDELITLANNFGNEFNELYQ